MPPKQPEIVTPGTDGLEPLRLISCPSCSTLYDGQSELWNPTTGRLTTCEAAVANPLLPGTMMPCGAPLGVAHPNKSGSTSMRPLTTVCVTELKSAVRAMLEREDYAYTLVNEDLRDPRAFRRTQCFSDFAEHHPELANETGLITFGLYCDYFKMHENARVAAKAQAGAVYLRPLHLPPHLAILPEYNILVAVLNGAYFSECMSYGSYFSSLIKNHPQGRKTARAFCRCSVLSSISSTSCFGTALTRPGLWTACRSACTPFFCCAWRWWFFFSSSSFS